MKIFQARKWSVIDIGCLKWSCILFGMILGAYLADFTIRYVWLFAFLAFLLAIKPLLSYFNSSAE